MIIIISAPAPLSIISAPAPPVIVSAAPPPVIISAPAPPVRISAPAPPVIVKSPEPAPETLIVAPEDRAARTAFAAAPPLLTVDPPAVKLTIPVAFNVAPELTITTSL